MVKLSKAQQEVLDTAKERIDFARTHSFYDWFREGDRYFRDATDEEIKAVIDKRTAEGSVINWEYETTHYEWNRNGIDYLCHASSATIRKLESLGLIEIIKDSNGEYYGFDQIRILNY